MKTSAWPARCGLRRTAQTAFVLAALACVLFAAASAHAATHHVDISRGNDFTGDGSIGSPYQHIWKGLDEAVYGDTVKVAAGVYEPSVGELLPLDVPTGVTLQGNTTMWLPDPPRPLYPGLVGTVIEGDDTGRIMQIADGDPNTVVDGFYFRNNAPPARGAAIYISGGSALGDGPIVRDCVFTLLSAPGGGAIRVEKGAATWCRPVIERCFFGGLEASGFDPGGAIWSTDAGCRIRECTFVACKSYMGSGGALYAEGGGTTLVERCTFGGCSSNVTGGGVAGADHDLRIRECTFVGNDADHGGAINQYVSPAAPTTWLWVDNCVLVDNSADARGGAISLGGGDANAYVINGTVLENTAGVEGGGLASEGTLYVRDTILWDNGDDLLAIGGGTAAADHSCIQDLDPGVGVIHDDPQLYSVGVPSATPHWRLLPDSPCIDAGSTEDPLSIDREGRPRPVDGDGNGIAVVDIGAYERSPIVGRVAGPDRYRTAIAASAAHFDRADTVVLATGADYPDALCAAPLAGFVYGPILLTAPSELPSGLITELERLGTEKIYVVGGTSAVSESVEDALRDREYAVERLAGADRYSTSEAIAGELSEMTGASLSRLVVVARGDAFPDALAASPFAWRQLSPILLTQPTRLPSATRRALTDLGFTEAFVLGGESAVSSPVFDEIGDLMSGGGAIRIAGTDRYATAVAFARHIQDSPTLGDRYREDFVGLATGSNFPDALCGGAACGLRSGPLLLTQPDALPSGVRDYVDEYADTMVDVEAFGGTTVVSDSVLTQVRGLIP